MAGRAYVFSKPKRRLSDDPARTSKAEVVGRLLLQIGVDHGDRFPWHHTDDPFRILVAEYLLARTARTIVEPIYNEIFKLYPHPIALAHADTKQLAEVTKSAGLPTKTAGLKGIAEQVVRDNGVKPDRSWLLSLPFVGDYVADAVLLYAFKQRVVPLDRNFQRVVHRIFFGQAPPKRSVEPYRDPETVYVVEEMTAGLSIEEVRSFHQGLLVVAWNYCRHSPRISLCPLEKSCLYAQRGK